MADGGDRSSWQWQKKVVDSRGCVESKRSLAACEAEGRAQGRRLLGEDPRSVPSVFELVVDVSDGPMGKGGHSLPLAPGGTSGTEKTLCKCSFWE